MSRGDIFLAVLLVVDIVALVVIVGGQHRWFRERDAWWSKRAMDQDTEDRIERLSAKIDRQPKRLTTAELCDRAWELNTERRM